MRKVEASAREKVLGLSDVHPEALQVERVQLPIGDHGGESLAFDRCRLDLDALQNRGVAVIAMRLSSQTKRARGAGESDQKLTRCKYQR